MRIARSCIAASNRAPSSIPLRPSFHCSATRMEYCSIVSGCVVGTISTAIWLPRFSSKARSRASKLSCAERSSVPVRSVTRERSSGPAMSPRATATKGAEETNTASAASAAGFTKPSSADRRLPRFGRRVAEVHLGWDRELLLVLDREARPHRQAEQLRGQIGGEGAYRYVVALDRLDVALAGHRDAVLRPLELRLQVAEVRVGFELRIILRDGEQPRQCRGHL